jgi:hypothetical protein
MMAAVIRGRVKERDSRGVSLLNFLSAVATQTTVPSVQGRKDTHVALETNLAFPNRVIGGLVLPSAKQLRAG